jgi:hypothetical protein
MGDDWDEAVQTMIMIELMSSHALRTSGMLEQAIHIDKYLSRRPYRTPKLPGIEWVMDNLHDPDRCYTMFRMNPEMFHKLHDVLTETYGLKSSRKSTSLEALGIFLWMLGDCQSVRQAKERFERSLGTISRLFNKVLVCMDRLAADILKPVDPTFSTMHDRLRSPRFYPYFKDCIGAIDGTHIPLTVPSNLFVQYLNRKGRTTQNVLAVCDFDMRFSFVLAGWPGSAHDMRVFNDATSTFGDQFPHPPPGILSYGYMLCLLSKLACFCS